MQGGGKENRQWIEEWELSEFLSPADVILLEGTLFVDPEKGQFPATG